MSVVSSQQSSIWICRLTLLAVAMAGSPAIAGKPCEELKTEIAAGMTTRGFNDFQLEVVPATDVGTRTIVGSCEGGSKKILYSRAVSEVQRASLTLPTEDSPSTLAARPAVVPPISTAPSTAVPKATGASQPLANNMPGSRVISKPLRSGAAGKEVRDRLSDGGEGPTMVLISAGEFLMGSVRAGIDRRYREGPERKVRVAAFALARTETTFAEYDRFATATKRRLPSDDGQGRGNRPVVDVSWEDAVAYAAWLSTQTGFTYRLPSEAEWEYSVRAGGKAGAAYGTGDCISANQANFNDAAATVFNNCPSANLSLGKAQPVGSYPPNAFGLYDMHGNVFEWTADCVHLSYEQAPSDARAWLQDNDGNCGERMVRGGSWQSGQISVRSSLRAAIGFSDPSGLIGFRVARDM